MAIDGGMRKSLQAGTRLVATYRKQQHVVEVVDGEDGKLRFRLADGRQYSSPSAAGSAVMGGVSCNGWRFFSLQTDDAEEPKPAAAKQSRTKTTQAAKKPARGVKPKPASEAEPAHDEPVDEQASEPVVNEEVTAD